MELKSNTLINFTVLGLMISVALGCGNLEKSEYKRGDYKEPKQSANTQPSPRPNNNPPPPAKGEPENPSTGSQGTNTPNPGEPTDGSATSNQPPAPPIMNKPGTNSEPIPEEPKQSGPDLAFDTGLDSCVKDAVIKELGQYYAPPTLQRSLDDWQSRTPKDQGEFAELADLILRKVVNTKGLVDYQALRSKFKDQWSRLIRAREDSEVMTIPQGKSQNEAMAFWTNIYNLTMIDIIVKNPQVNNIAIDIGFSIFDEPHKVGVHQLSLNQIEKGILKLGGGTVAAPQDLIVPKLESRLHYTLVCGAISCPKLRNFYYSAEDMQTILRENALLVANSHKFFTIVDDWVQHTGLISFYEDDFHSLYGNNYVGITNDMLSSCRNDISTIKGIMNAGQIFPDNYDWSVNKQ